jgi:hypothetical protein
VHEPVSEYLPNFSVKDVWPVEQKIDREGSCERVLCDKHQNIDRNDGFGEPAHHY